MSSFVDIPPPDRIQADVEHLKEWMAKEPHLPSIDDEEWLKTFLYNNKFSLEKTKSKLDSYYFVRSKYPEYFKNRDPTAPEIEKLKQVFKHSMGHKPMKDGSKVIMVKYEGDPSAFDMTAYCKRLLMHWDMLLLDPANRLTSLVVITDCSHIKPMHTVKFMTVVNALLECNRNAYSFRIVGQHIVNLPSFAQTVIEAVTKLMPKKMNDRIYMHNSMDSLFEQVDRDVVCKDFGGTGPSLAELEDRTLEKLKEIKDWFKEQDSICSNEELRSKYSNNPEEMKGSFRKLAVD